MCNLRSKIRPSHSPSSPGPARPGASRRNPTGQRRARFADGMASATRGRHRPTRWAQFMFRPPPPPDDEFATRSKKRPAATGTRGDCRARLDAAHHRRVGPVLDGAIEYRCPPPPSAAGTTPRRCMRKGGGEFTVVVFAPPPPAGTRHLPPSRGRPSQCMRKGGEEFPVVVFAPRGGRERNARTAVPLDTACRAHRREDRAPCILPRTRCPGTSTPVRVDHIGRGKNNIPSTVVRRARRGIFPPPPPPAPHRGRA